MPAKAQGNQTPEDYRPITLFNSDYNILARIIAQRLRPVLVDHLTETNSVGFLEIRSLARWQRYVITSRMRKTGGSRYACFPMVLKMLSIGSPTTTCFKHSRETALETPLSPVSIGCMKVLVLSSNKWPSVRTHTNSLRSAAEVSDEYGPLCSVSTHSFAFWT